MGEGLRSVDGEVVGRVGVGIDTTDTFSGSGVGVAAGSSVAGEGVVEGEGVVFVGVCDGSSVTGAATDFGGTW